MKWQKKIRRKETGGWEWIVVMKGQPNHRWAEKGHTVTRWGAAIEAKRAAHHLENPDEGWKELR